MKITKLFRRLFKPRRDFEKELLKEKVSWQEKSYSVLRENLGYLRDENERLHADILQMQNIMVGLGASPIRTDKGWEIMIMDMDDEANHGRLWAGMTAEQQDRCRKKWQKTAEKKEREDRGKLPERFI